MVLRARAALLAAMTVSAFVAAFELRAALFPDPNDDERDRQGTSSRVIDGLMEAKWTAEKVKPAPRCTDGVFLRRATLDLVGRIPTRGEVLAFENDARAGRRDRLVDRLLASDEFNAYWARVWSHWLLGDVPERRDEVRLRDWLAAQFRARVSVKELTVQLLTASGKGRKNGAVHFLRAHLGMPLLPRHHASLGKYDTTPLASATARVFLGVSLECARCHKHKFDSDIQEKHFHCLVACFRRLDCVEDDEDVALADNRGLCVDGTIVWEQVTKGTLHATRPRFVDGTPWQGGIRTPREFVADKVVEHPHFAPNQLERVWTMLFGHGLRPYRRGDLWPHVNEVTHADLLHRLSRDFVAQDYDLRRVLRSVCASRVYQLADAIVTRPHPADEDPVELFDRRPPRSLSLDQLVESLLVALRVEVREMPELRWRWREALAPPATVASACGEVGDRLPIRSAGAGLLQLREEPTLTEYLDGKKGLLAEVSGWNRPEAIVAELYLNVLGRRPTGDEAEKIAKEVKAIRDRDASGDLLPLWQDLLWALFASREFHSVR